MRYVSILIAILKEPRSLLITIVVAWLVFTGAVWFPNISLITIILGSSASLLEKFVFLGTLYQSIITNFTIISATYTLLIAILFGIQIALLLYYIRKTKTNRASLQGIGGTGLGGLVAGMFGIGCAACGTFILAAVLSLAGAGGLLVFLPLGGEEFGFLGVGLLLYSIWLLLKKIETPIVCPI